ncbi:C-C motif chemokine 19a.1 [Astyanax mexicanus]|uniref:C-C motif chemokine 19-like n=1 Tax=Astyanax mexicanus TaxID=7994 RepID=A0A8B9JZQ7_ASTMX|nr:C-C motif chemokine 19a.1 [Astyanax mexicanus]KAG9261977.1 C-C motif chemokine 19-like [Astyanax mexicanus]
MAPSGVRSLCVALWITAIIISSNVEVSLGDQAMDCCLSVSHQVIPSNIVVRHRDQVKGEGCPISAVIFVTKKGKYLCAPSGEQWVNNLKTEVDRILHKCQKNNFKGRRCHGMKLKYD